MVNPSRRVRSLPDQFSDTSRAYERKSSMLPDSVERISTSVSTSATFRRRWRTSSSIAVKPRRSCVRCVSKQPVTKARAASLPALENETGDLGSLSFTWRFHESGVWLTSSDRRRLVRTFSSTTLHRKPLHRYRRIPEGRYSRRYRLLARQGLIQGGISI